MTFATNFRRTYEVMVARQTGPEVAQFLADRAEDAALELIATRAASPQFRRMVNGLPASQGVLPGQSLIKLDGTGSIRYVFSSMAAAAAFALEFAVNHSPRLSGAYADNWYLLVDTVPYASADLNAIKIGAEVTLSNNSDYHRKIDVGGMMMSVAPQIVEATRQAVMRKFPGITCERIFLTIPGGYVLKGRAVRSGISYDKKTRKFYRKNIPLFTNRADSKRGQVMTYPSLVMSELR